MLFWYSLDFQMSQQILTILSLVPLPFLNPTSTSGISWFTYHWSLAWRILSITFWCVSWLQLCGSLNILWHCLSLGLEWKLTFSSPVVTVELSKFCWYIDCSTFTASSFRIWNNSTGIPSLTLTFFIVMLPKAHFSSDSRIYGSRMSSSLITSH